MIRKSGVILGPDQGGLGPGLRTSWAEGLGGEVSWRFISSESCESDPRPAYDTQLPACLSLYPQQFCPGAGFSPALHGCSLLGSYCPPSTGDTT